jgi:stage II sporulation protein AA (anti-sigma F factor antagonist)
LEVKLSWQNDTLIAELVGEIDHHSALAVRECIDDEIRCNAPRMLILDFTGVTFMDSSGIGLVIGRFKAVSELGGTLKVVGASKHIAKVMKLSGIDKLGLSA